MMWRESEEVATGANGIIKINWGNDDIPVITWKLYKRYDNVS